MKPSNEKFMEDFQNELMSFQNIPKKNRPINSRYSSVQENVKSSNQSHDNNLVSYNEDVLFTKIDPAFSELQKVKSTNTNSQINKLHNTLSAIERKSNVEVAKKYLNGFLEERGINSLKQFINSFA